LAVSSSRMRGKEMIHETLPSGLVVLRDKPEPKPVNRVEQSARDGETPLPPHPNDWHKSLTTEEKDEILAFLPSIFLRVESMGLSREVLRLIDRAAHLSGKEFEVYS
jgi:hypothetical protein